MQIQLYVYYYITLLLRLLICYFLISTLKPDQLGCLTLQGLDPSLLVWPQRPIQRIHADNQHFQAK